MALLALIVSFAQVALVRAEDMVHGAASAVPLFITLALGLGLRLDAVEHEGIEPIIGWMGVVVGL